MSLFRTDGTLSPPLSNRHTDAVDPDELRDARLSARLSKFSQHDKSRANTSCGLNSYIKPKTLKNISVNYNTFDRFKKIQS